MAMTEQNFIDAGYKRFNPNGQKNADFGLQKLISDDKGKKYYITVLAYDWTKYREHVGEPFSFMPDVQFRIDKNADDEYFFTINMGGSLSVERIESECEKLWVHFGCPYYEEWDK